MTTKNGIIEEKPEDSATAETPDLEAPGMDILRSAFGTDEFKSEVESPESSVTENQEEQEVSEGEAEGSPEDSAEPDEDEVLRKTLSDPRVQFGLRQYVAQQLAAQKAQLDAEEARRRLEEETALLSDEELGQRQRLQQQLAPVMENARRQGYVQAQHEFLQNAVGDVWDMVPELKNLPVPERDKLNPLSPQFKSYGEYVSALIETVVNKRLETEVKKEAQKLADAMVRDRMSEFRKTQPIPEGVSGPSFAPTRIVDVEEMDGRELLRVAFGA